MSTHVLHSEPVGGPILTKPFKILAVLAVGGVREQHAQDEGAAGVLFDEERDDERSAGRRASIRLGPNNHTLRLKSSSMLSICGERTEAGLL